MGGSKLQKQPRLNDQYKAFCTFADFKEKKSFEKSAFIVIVLSIILHQVIVERNGYTLSFSERGSKYVLQKKTNAHAMLKAHNSHPICDASMPSKNETP